MKELSNSEIFETRTIIENYFAQANYDDLEELRDNTLQVLQNLNLTILKRFDLLKLRKLSISIKSEIHKFLRKTKRGVKQYSKCLVCKIALRILLYGFAATIGVAIAAINMHFTSVVDLLANFFEQSTQSITTFLTSYGFFKLLDVNDLIEKLCENYGWC